MNERELVFLISQPRSGSTFVQKILSNNREIGTASEPWILLQFAPFLRPSLIQSKFDYSVTNEAFVDFLERFGAQEKFNQQIKQQLLSLYEHAKGAHDLFLDKTPRYYELLDEIIAIFPYAKYIVLKRHPLAVLNSMIRTWCSGVLDFRMLDSFHRDFLHAPFLIQKFVERNRGKANIIECSYEGIIHKPETEIQKIYAWLGIGYSPDVLSFSGNRKVYGKFGDDVYGVKREPNYKVKPVQESVTNWAARDGNSPISEFLTGYSDFLGEKFLEMYGYRTVSERGNEHSAGKSFREFIYYHENKLLVELDTKAWVKHKLNRLFSSRIV